MSSAVVANDDSLTELVEQFARVASYREDQGGTHARRVGVISAALARNLGLPKEFVELIRLAAPLHDVGKIGIPDHILLKPAALAPEEFEVIKTHTTIGARILSGGRSPLWQMAGEIALTHHERWDGAGYPQGLRSKTIPLSGRIVALADAFDALTSVRPYRRRWSFEAAVAEVKRGAETAFDPEVVDAFLLHTPQRWKSTERHPDSHGLP